jgi:Anti-sigma-K factor rskA
VTRSEDWADYLDPGEPNPDLPPQQRGPLDRATVALATDAVWSAPPASVRAALLEAATREAAAGTRAMPLSARPQPEAKAPPVPLRPRAHRRWFVATVGAAAAAALVAVLVWRSQPQPATVALSGTALAPRANAVAELTQKKAGLAITLQITGLPPAPAGQYYAAWLSGPPGIVPLGTFHWRRGGVPISLWSGVGTDRYRQLFVTLQREGQPPLPSSVVVLSGTAPG